MRKAEMPGFPSNISLCFAIFHTVFQSSVFSQITPPSQPASGPGGSVYNHQSVTKNKYGSGGTAYWIYEPANPKPDSANFILFNHGWGALNPACYGRWLDHLVRKGNVIVFPKWQFDLNTLPQFFTPNAAAAVKDAINEIATGNHVKPRYENTAYIGYSFGGVISSNLAILADSIGIPEPKALLVCNGGNGYTMGSLLPTYTTMPDIKLLIISGDDDVIVADTFGRMLFDSTIGVDPLFKNHITQYYDGHGNPAIESTHNEPISWDSAYWSSDFFDNNWVVSASYGVSKTDAVDFYCYWKFADAITDCAYYGTNCEYAFCNTPDQRYMGTWSDNQPITELFVESKSPCSSGTEIPGKFPEITIFPNPGNGEFSIEIPSDWQGADLSIFNVTGELIMGASLTSDRANLHLNPGIYFLKIHSGKKTFSQKTIVH